VGLVLDRMEPLLRLILVMAQTFHWSETRISAYLQAEGESISPSEVKELLNRSYYLLEDNLPADIHEIYSGQKMSFTGLDSDVNQQVLQS